MKSFAFFPEQASSLAADVDMLYFALIGISVFFTVLISVLIVLFAIVYRRRPGNEIATETPEPKVLEIGWSILPFVLGMVLFAWGTEIFVRIYSPKDHEALHIYGVGKQWMWKFQHPDGRREINDLHLPVGQAVKVTLISQDVLHSFYVPAFRIKQDVLPSRYTTTWFTPTKTGTYHLFCAEYCGAEHSRMVGTVHVLDTADYQRWLSSPLVEGGAPRVAGSMSDTMASAVAPVAASVGGSLGANSGLSADAESGRKFMETTGCFTCHGNQVIAPKLEGIFGTLQPLADGHSVRADENYIRESILNPTAKVVKGFAPAMPPYAGQVKEEDILLVIRYIKESSKK